MLEKMVETREEVFFNYARQCLSFLKGNARVPEAVYEQLVRHREEGTVPAWDLIEKAFINAIPEYWKFVRANKLDEYSPDSVRRFWLEHHNTYANKECHVFVGLVESISDDGNGSPVYTVKCPGFCRKFSGKWFRDAKFGDRISVHLGFASEKLK
ncbi:hypothetical protein KY338_04415 [Candidatus Woesearchaeota archaeon]|nr:hypothetical protein [Candidatus Woesearchaeota archaeon]MBW3005775.1 hypothetical protein [Candidatus Woesearchaeota archaeon]